LPLVKEGLLVQGIVKTEQAMFLRPHDPKQIVMLMRLYMPAYRNDVQKSHFYTEEVLNLDPSHQIVKNLIAPPSKAHFRYLLMDVTAECVVFGGLLWAKSSSMMEKNVRKPDSRM
jgi:hypothetical protein